MRKLKMIQADIDNGVPNDPCWCPIANMIAREYEIPDVARQSNIWVGPPAIKIKKNYVFSNYDGYLANNNKLIVPKHVSQFITAFDNYEHVEPIEIEIPE